MSHTGPSGSPAAAMNKTERRKLLTDIKHYLQIAPPHIVKLITDTFSFMRSLFTPTYPGRTQAITKMLTALVNATPENEKTLEPLPPADEADQRLAYLRRYEIREIQNNPNFKLNSVHFATFMVLPMEQLQPGGSSGFHGNLIPRSKVDDYPLLVRHCKSAFRTMVPTSLARANSAIL